MSAFVQEYENPVYQIDLTDKSTTHPPTEKRISTKNNQTNNSVIYAYGWGFLTIKQLQILNRPLFFLIVICIAVLAQGLVITGVTSTVLTSVEKQFGLKSTEAGFLFIVTYDVAYGFCSIFVSYIGNRHKPRFIGCGLFLMAIGCFLITIPKFLFGNYYAGVEVSTDYCELNANFTDTKCVSSGTKWYFKAIFALGYVLMGIGATPLYTLAPAHIDETTKRGQGSLYLGIYYMFAALGPAIGFIIGQPILSTWVDIEQKGTSILTPLDRNWVGAWWVGFIVGAAILLLPVIPMLGFPRIFPNTAKAKEEKRQHEDTIQSNHNLNFTASSVWPSIKQLLKTKPFIFITLAIACESMAIGGFSTFIPKFVETQFHFPASSSALYTGCIVVPGAAGGIFMGGYLSKRFRWTCRKQLIWSCFMAFFSTIAVAGSLVGCTGRDVIGGTVPYHNTAVVSFNNTCNANCHCSTKFYKPVCSVEDQKTFYSLCHAGCEKSQSRDEKYENCRCLAPEASTVVGGRCVPECSMFPLFVVVAFLLMFLTFMNNVPMVDATLKVVPQGLGSFAMGIQQVFVRFLGFIPAPTVFGSLIDKSCILWHKDDCTGETTSCLEYDNEDFRYAMFLLGVVTKFLSFVFIFCAFKTYKLPNRCCTEETSEPQGPSVDLNNFADNNAISVATVT